MRYPSFLVYILVACIPLGVAAQTSLVDSQATLSDLTLLIAQYETRIKQLQSENAVLRLEMTKAGIKIPLVDLSGATTPIPTSVTPVVIPNLSTTGSVSPSTDPKSADTLADITKVYGKDASGFISRINQDWSAIKSNYTLPSGARLAGYEFVQSGALDHVFADIVIGTGTAGVYDIKMLYQFDKSDYKRKLIGIFEYNPTTERYTTRVGSNPFAGSVRTFVADPYYTGIAKVPSTALVPSGTTTPPTVVTPTATGSATAPSSSTSVVVADITKAYNEKRYLSTISLSNTYLEKNTATPEILNIRYRTYFIIGKYTESLAELAKIEKLGTLDKQTACNAQVIATYSKNQPLVDKYAALCKK